MFSFDHATGVMYTCDAFGAHYATDAPFDTELASLSPHFRFYYDCLMRPNARSVLTALRKVKDLDYTTVATGHGPIIRYNLEELVGRRGLCLDACIACLEAHAPRHLRFQSWTDLKDAGSSLLLGVRASPIVRPFCSPICVEYCLAL